MKKKSFFIAAVLVALSSMALGQKAFQKGTNDINIGVGFLGVVWQGTSYGASYEHGYTDKLGAGVHLGYSTYSKDGYNYTAVIVGVKGMYHFSTTDKLDPYTGAELGFISISHTGSNESTAAHKYTPVGIGFFGGVRYYVAPSVAIYGELHLSTFSILGAGVSFKF